MSVLGVFDKSWAEWMYEHFSAGTWAEMFSAELAGEPWAKLRPRFTKGGHAYQDPKDRLAEERTGWRLKAAGAPRFDGNVMIACLFYRSAPGTVDADNLLKHVCDAAKGLLWKDDCQATLMLGQVELDPERPRTIIVAGRHKSSMRRLWTGSAGSSPTCMISSAMTRPPWSSASRRAIRRRASSASTSATRLRRTSSAS